jgi:hypothetical protein
MRHARVRVAVLALIVVGAVGIVVPTQASALSSYYNCVNKPNLEWCDGRANGTYDGQHSWDYNEGWHPGGGSFYVCQGIYKPSTGGWLDGHSCGLDGVSHYYGNVMCACYDAKVAQTSGSAQSINGFADADW